jgi:hypothetical protein
MVAADTFLAPPVYGRRTGSPAEPASISIATSSLIDSLRSLMTETDNIY